MILKKILSVVLAATMLAGIMLTGVAVSAETELPFTDVKKNWAYEPIKYVYETGLMNGTGNGTQFSPDMNLSRAMVVTVLYRNSGAPEVSYKGHFADISSETKYYTSAVIWAKDNGIVTAADIDEWGDEYFRPDRDITRQELATMFKRYAEYKHVITDDRADISKYPDADNVAKNWALDAVQWSVSVGLITGKSNNGVTTLAPKAKATRAEFAAIIQRFDAAEFDYEIAYETPTYGTYTEKDYPLVTDADIYVAVDGNDNNPGTLEKPIATFERAVEMVRELKKTATDGIKVAFKAGNYGSLTYRFTIEDTGTAEVPIEYCAYGDGDVIFSNGIEINENDFIPLDDADKAKFNDDAVDNIYKVDVSKYLTDDMNLDNSIMFNTEQECNIARYPDVHSLSNHTDKVNDTTIVFTMGGTKAIIDSFKSLEGAKTLGYFKYEWLGETFTVTGYDKTTGQMTLDIGTSGNGIGGEVEGECNHTFYLFDFAYALDYEGEYWIDKDEKVLYAYAPKGDYMLAIEGDMIWLEGDVDYITFRGLDLKGTTGTAFYAEFSDHITIDQCSFYAIGGDWAVGFSYTRSGCSDSGKSTKYVGSAHITFTNNEMSYMAKGGFRAYGGSRDHDPANYQNLIDDNSLIENNLIHDLGWADPFNSSGISVTSFFGLDVRHNEIYNTAREAVGLNGQCRNMNFEYNVIHDAMLQSDDGGAFYHGRSHEARGNVLRYNLFYNIRTGSGRYAIYFDDGMSGQEVYGNVFYNAGDVAILLNGGRDNYIHDNMFINTNRSTRALWTNDKYYNAAVEAVTNNTEYHYGNTDANVYKNLPDKNTELGKRWFEEFPEMYDIIPDYTQYDNPLCHVTPTSHYENNYFFTEKSNEEYFDFDEPTLKFSTIINNRAELSLETNDFFVDPTHGNYAIKDGADFMDNHYEKIGRY